MRFLNLAKGVHAFVVGEAEAAPFRDKPDVWKYEKIVGYVFASPGSGLLPVHRLAAPDVPGFRIAVGDAERDAVLASDPTFAPAGQPFYVRP